MNCSNFARSYCQCCSILDTVPGRAMGTLRGTGRMKLTHTSWRSILGCDSLNEWRWHLCRTHAVGAIHKDSDYATNRVAAIKQRPFNIGAINRWLAFLYFQHFRHRPVRTLALGSTGRLGGISLRLRSRISPITSARLRLVVMWMGVGTSRSTYSKAREPPRPTFTRDCPMLTVVLWAYCLLVFRSDGGV